MNFILVLLPSPHLYLPRTKTHLLDGLQGVWVNPGDEVGLSTGIVILTHRVNIHQGVIRHLHTFEVGEKPEQRKPTGSQGLLGSRNSLGHPSKVCSTPRYLEKMFLQGSG